VLSGGPPASRAPASGKPTCPACQCAAPAWEDTGWDRIIELRGLLLSVSANPAVALNRAVAVMERDGPAAGLGALDAVTQMPRSQLWHASRPKR